MGADLHAILSRDHERLESFLGRALRSDGSVEPASYGEFRGGLLRHIGIEERILFPEVRKRGGDTALVAQLHRDHAALSALLVLPPERTGIEVIRGILAVHDPLEENSGGLYEQVEDLTGADLSTIVSRLLAYPPVRLAAHADTPLVRRTIEQLIRDAEAGRRALRERSG